MSAAAPPAAAGSAAAAPVLSNHEAFLLLLNDPPGCAALLDFLKAGYSEHHLVFWQEVTQAYRPLTDQSARDALARDMWHRYGKNGSASQINITEPQRLRLQAAIERIGSKDPSSGETYGAAPDLFDEAAAHCLELIKGNYFFPFQQSKQYAAYKAEKAARDAAAAAQASQADTTKKKSAACVIL